jgi:hypothetical protein
MAGSCRSRGQLPSYPSVKRSTYDELRVDVNKQPTEYGKGFLRIGSFRCHHVLDSRLQYWPGQLPLPRYHRNFRCVLDQLQASLSSRKDYMLLAALSVIWVQAAVDQESPLHCEGPGLPCSRSRTGHQCRSLGVCPLARALQYLPLCMLPGSCLLQVKCTPEVTQWQVTLANTEGAVRSSFKLAISTPNRPYLPIFSRCGA